MALEKKSRRCSDSICICDLIPYGIFFIVIVRREKMSPSYCCVEYLPRTVPLRLQVYSTPARVKRNKTFDFLREKEEVTEVVVVGGIYCVLFREECLSIVNPRPRKRGCRASVQ